MSAAVIAATNRAVPVLMHVREIAQAMHRLPVSGYCFAGLTRVAALNVEESIALMNEALDGPHAARQQRLLKQARGQLARILKTAAIVDNDDYDGTSGRLHKHSELAALGTAIADAARQACQFIERVAIQSDPEYFPFFDSPWELLKEYGLSETPPKTASRKITKAMAGVPVSHTEPARSAEHV